MSEPGTSEFSAEERSILEQRARMAARRAKGASEVGPGDDIVVVRCGTGLYGLPGREVLAVAALTRLSPLPLTPPNVAGLTTFRGGVVVVFHLHAVLGIPPSLSEYGRIVVLDQECALAVDAVERSEPLGELRPPPQDLERTASLVQGVTPSGVAVIDVERLRRSDAFTVDIPTSDVGSSADNP